MVKSNVSIDELKRLNDYWRASIYLCAGMIYLRENSLLRKPLKMEHIKERLLGHFGSTPGQSLIWVHMNRVIKKYDLNAIFVSGPGHGAPAVLANAYLEGFYSEVYSTKSEDEEGMDLFFKEFSFPGGVGSHCTPETPGSLHEGGELGYSLSHAYGVAFDNPDLIVACMIGDGEAETGPLATAWHSNKFLNPVRDGCVLPILHVNGYKIANPTIFARMSDAQLESLFIGYGYKPYFVEGTDPMKVHKILAETMDEIVKDIQDIQKEARTNGVKGCPVWPMIILRTPKGWTCPKEIDGHKLEGSWRAHQVPFKINGDQKKLKLLENWLKSYTPDKFFDKEGKLISELKSLAPKGKKRMSANPVNNGGELRKRLRLPDFKKYAVKFAKPGNLRVENTKVLGKWLCDVMKKNMEDFRLFGPDETASNRLSPVYDATKKIWMLDYLPEDKDGGHLSTDGRVMEMLSEHTLEGWLEGYVLSGRHGLIASYESFIHVIDSMFNQHAKWLDKCNRVPWREPIASLNILISSVVWRQDHNGFSHQDPGFLDLVTNKSAKVTRIYLPPDANCLLSVGNHCLKSTNYVNVIVSDKQPHLQYLSMKDAITHCSKGIGIWDWASTDEGCEPDLIMACCGDVTTKESLAATAILRKHFPELKIRFVNVVDLFKLEPEKEHLHGLSDREFDDLFTKDKPVIFNFHGYPSLIHKLCYRRTNHANLHVRGYKEEGDIDTPLGLAIANQIDRFNLAIDAIERVPKLTEKGAHVIEWLRNQIIETQNYAFEHGVDKPEFSREWVWPF